MAGTPSPTSSKDAFVERIPKDWRILAAGGIAGAVSRTVVSPLERLKIEFQVQDILHDKSHKLDKSLVRGIMQIYERDGVKGWFKGNGTNVLRMLPYSSTQFWTYERVKEVIMKGKPAGTKDITPVERLGAGAISGVVSAGLTYPLDVIRGRLTVQGPTTSFHYKGITDAFITMSRQEGLRGLYRGIAATIVGIMPYMGTQFMVYGGLKNQMQEWFGTGPDKRNVPQWVALFNGGLAGAAAQTVAYPFDLLRRRYQVAGLGKNGGGGKAYTSMFSAFVSIVKEEGFLALYNGLVPNYAKVIPTMAVSFWVYEVLKEFFNLNENGPIL